MQLIFQDSSASLNPRMTVEQIVKEPLVIQKQAKDKARVREMAIMHLKSVGLDEMYLSKISFRNVRRVRDREFVLQEH